MKNFKVKTSINFMIYFNNRGKLSVIRLYTCFLICMRTNYKGYQSILKLNIKVILQKYHSRAQNSPPILK